MKKLFFLTAALALVLGLSQCRKPNASAINGGNGTQHVVLEASFDNGGSKIAEDGNGDLKWATGDEITVRKGGVALEPGTLTCTDAENGIFTGDIATTSGNTTFTFGEQNFESQTGTLDGAISLSSGDVVYNPEGSYTNVQMTMPHAVLKLDLRAFGTADGNDVTISAGGSVVASVTGVKGTSTGVYVAMPAAESREYKFRGNCYYAYKTWKKLEKNTFYTKEGSSTGEAIVIEPDAVDFGLPSSLKWALRNIGATCSTTNPTDPTTATTWYGDYYAWAGVAPYYTSITWNTATSCSPTWKSGYGDGYSWAHCPYTNGTYSDSNKAVFTKYVPQDKATTYGYNGCSDVKTVLDLSDPCDDAARAVLGGTWRMPTGGMSGEWNQLKDNTLFVWTTSYRGISNLKGYVVYKVKATSHKGQRVATSSGNGECSYSGTAYALTDPHMFLPAAGLFLGGTSLYFACSRGYYRSSSLYSVAPDSAWHMDFGSGDVSPRSIITRYNGLSVRPVQ